MELPNPKDLKKLASMCRKSGIKQLKIGDIEFTLSEELPTKTKKSSKQALPEASDTKFETDTLTDNELLFWSTGTKADELSDETTT